MSNINENICQAIDIIIQERLSHISFDSTILCKVVDDSKKEQGVYVVKSDEVRFEAYSTLNTLAVGDSVYVQIPNGDWNEQKFILSKKTLSDENPSLTYKNPFANFIDITGNLISDAQTTECGLLANGSQEEIEIWHYNATEQEEPLKSYTTLGIKAGFKTLLNPFHYYVKNDEEVNEYKTSSITKGNYGLRLKIVSKLENVTSEKGATKGEAVKAGEYILELNETNMNGNPYNFFTYANQEIIFNISEIYNILSMSLVFYQKKGSFTDDTGYAIQSTQANLFANNIGVYLGYGVDEINEEKVLIYSNDSSTYSAEAVDKTANNKKVRLRWIYKDAVSGSFRSVQPSDGMNFEVRWYRYRLGMPPADEYSGIYWIPLSKQTYDVNNKKYIYEVQDEDWLKQYAGVKPDFLTSWIFSDTEQPIEKVKAVILYNGQVYRSEILEFTNEEEVYSNEGLIEDILKEMTVLNIICKDGSWGNYFIYDESYRLINSADSAIPRQFLAFLNLKDQTEQDINIEAPIDNAEYVKWYIPKDNTMIQFKDENIIEEEYQGNLYNTIKKFPSNNQVHNSLTYYIRNIYNHRYTNNIILCEIKLNDGTIYTGSKELSFGVSGSNGTDTTLVLDFITPGEDCLDINIGYAKIQAKLYDQTGEDITEEALKLNSTSWEWEFIGENFGLIYIPDSDNKSKGTIQLKENITSEAIFNTWNILKCTLKGWGTYQLEAYLPIPVKQNVLLSLNNQFQDIFLDNYEYSYLSNNGQQGIRYLDNTKFQIQVNEQNITNGENTADKINSGSTLIKNEYVQSLFNNNQCLITKRLINYEKTRFNIHNIEIKKSKFILNFSINLLELTEETLAKDVWDNFNLIKVYPSFRIYLKINNKEKNIGSLLTSMSSLDDNTNNFFTQGAILSSTFTDNSSLPSGTALNLKKKNNFELIIDFSDQDDITSIKNLGIVIGGGVSNRDLYPYSISNLKFIEENSEQTSLEPLIVEGTTQVIYTTEGIPQYNHGIYQLYYRDIEGIKKLRYKEGSLDWKLITLDNKFTNPKLKAEKIENIKIGYSLQPCQFYDSESTKNIVIQAIDGENRVLWSQPILILQNNYFSSSINKWDGALKVDDKNNFIGATKLAAGTKTNSNGFTGMILGDYGTKANELSMGLYGFNEGATTFGFKTDGTAFIGQVGAGRIDFNGNSGIIQSGNWELIENSWNLPEPQGEETTIGGALFDLDDGKIILKRWKQEDVEDDDGNVSKQNVSYSITLDSQKNSEEYDYPLTIGTASNPNFKVKWDGTIEATGGKFSGELIAATGTFKGKLEAASGTFKGRLDAASGTFSGTISANEGDIGGWDIDTYKLYSNYTYEDEKGEEQNGYVKLSSSDEYAIEAGIAPGDGVAPFRVHSNGALYASNAIISGTVNANNGEIGGWKIADETIRAQTFNEENEIKTQITLKASGTIDIFGKEALRIMHDASDSSLIIGDIGYLEADFGDTQGVEPAPGIGIRCLSSTLASQGIAAGAIKITEYNVGLTATCNNNSENKGWFTIYSLDGNNMYSNWNSQYIKIGNDAIIIDQRDEKKIITFSSGYTINGLSNVVAKAVFG